MTASACWGTLLAQPGRLNHKEAASSQAARVSKLERFACFQDPLSPFHRTDRHWGCELTLSPVLSVFVCLSQLSPQLAEKADLFSGSNQKKQVSSVRGSGVFSRTYWLLMFLLATFHGSRSVFHGVGRPSCGLAGRAGG